MYLCTVDGMHSVWVMQGARAQSRRRAYLQSVCEPEVPAASRPTASQWPVTRARTAKHFARERVLLQESMCIAGEARTRAARVTSALFTRLLVCRAARAAWQWRGAEQAGHAFERMENGEWKMESRLRYSKAR